LKFGVFEKTSLLSLFCFLAAACSQESNTHPSAVTGPASPSTVAESAARTEQDAAAEAVVEEAPGLGGTSWRLVRVMEMDDSTHVPDDPSSYTLSFSTDGTVNLQADCNRGSGSWTSESASQLEFGPIAATRAMCPPGSLHDMYLAQFGWVRSYVMRDGHLFLATMADGSIIEFEPMEDN
jgi:heat shock protein HslJ